MESLKSVEVAEIAQITVNAKLGENIISVSKECIYLVKLLKVSVKLYWNGKHISIYKNDSIDSIISKTLTCQ